MSQNHNPLSNYFRQPAIYVKLPSQGNFWPSNAIELTINNELPVLPMTAVDEITYRTPDALYNGQSTVSVIQSCMPNIKNAWAMPLMDFDSVLIAIRIASYGHELEIFSTCPNCSHEENYSVDLRNVMDNLHAPDYNQILKFGDLEVNFKPLNYKQSNENSIRQFEEQKMLSLIGDDSIGEEERLQRMNHALKSITDMTITTLANCIAAIKIPSGLVTETSHIEEWLKNCERTQFNDIRDHIVALRTASDIKPLDLECPACQTKYQQTFTLDQSNFFGVAS